MKKKVFGDAGTKVVIEEFLQGQEISVHVLSDGKNYSLFPIALDHKTIFDDNRGPNTGGMGTIAPLKIDKKIFNEIEKTVVIPLLKYLEKKGAPFSGCLFPGIMLTKNGPKVLEFNARFGDPETQSYMRILKSDLFEILYACATKTLLKIKIKWSKSSACCIILASPGYPENYKKGEEILGLEKIKKQKNIVPFHAGTKLEKMKVITNGGRVLGISSIGKTLPEAIKTAYEALGDNKIYFKNMHYRKDIGMHWLNLKNKLKS